MAYQEGNKGKSTQLRSNGERRAGEESSPGSAAGCGLVQSCIGPAGVEAELSDDSFLLLLPKAGWGRWSCRWMVPLLFSSSSSSRLSLPPSSCCGVCHSACLQSCLLHPSLSVKLSHSLHYSPFLSATVLSVCLYLSGSLGFSLSSSHLIPISNKNSVLSLLQAPFYFPSHNHQFLPALLRTSLCPEHEDFSLFFLCLPLQGHDWEMNIAHTGLRGDQIASSLF